jgi:aminoglycoside/choline kinase family phosphotransferase
VNDRERLVLEWMNAALPVPLIRIAPASSDASFRRYFRVWYGDQTRIVMDAPPDKEDCRPFVAMAEALRGLGLNAPEVLDGDLDQGLLLLTDLGSRQYLAELNERSVAITKHQFPLGIKHSLRECLPMETDRNYCYLDSKTGRNC